MTTTQRQYELGSLPAAVPCVRVVFDLCAPVGQMRAETHFSRTVSFTTRIFTASPPLRSACYALACFGGRVSQFGVSFSGTVPLSAWRTTIAAAYGRWGRDTDKAMCMLLTLAILWHEASIFIRNLSR